MYNTMKTNLTLIFILIPFFLLSQELKLDDTGIVTDGNVTCLKSYGDSLIIGGRFNYLGKHTGGLSILDSNTSNLTSIFPKIYGNINTIVSDGNGGIYIGGAFNKVGAYNIENIAHINQDLTLDNNFHPNPNGPITSIIIKNNKLIIAGTFNLIGTSVRNKLAEIDKNNGAVSTWNPTINGTINSLLIKNDKFFIGGNFSLVNNTSLNHFAAFDTSGNTLLNTFSPNPNGYIQKMILHGNRIYLIGGFTIIDGTNRNKIASLSVTGGLLAFSPVIQSGAFPTDIISFQNKVIISFTETGVSPYVNKYDTTTSSNTLLLTNVTTDGTSIGIAGIVTDKIYYTTNGNFYSPTRTYCRLLVENPNTNLLYADSRAFNVNGTCNAVIEYGDKILIGGNFSSTHGFKTSNIAIYNTNSNSILYFNPDFGSNLTNSTINDVEVIPNGIVAVGKITFNNGTLNYGRIWRFNSSGQITKTMSTYMSNSANGTEVSRVKLIDNNLFVYGNFDQIDNTNGRPRITKIDTSLTIISYFPAPSNSNTFDDAQVRIFDIIGHNGNIIFGGGKIFNTLGGTNIGNFYPVYMLNSFGGFVRSLTSSTIMDYFNKSIIYGDTIYSIYNLSGTGGIRSTIIANNTNIANYFTNSNNTLTTFELYNNKLYYVENVNNSGNPYLVLKTINRSSLTGVTTIDTVSNQTVCSSIINNKLFLGGGPSFFNSQADFRQGIRSYNILSEKPSIISSNLSISNITNTSMNLSWTSGNGIGRIVVAKLISANNVPPVAGVNYYANNTFGLGSNLIDSSFVVYNGTGNSVQVNGLQPNKTYHFAVFEYNGVGNSINYQTNGVSYISGITLPITLVSFKGQKEAGKVILSWITSSEINNSHFEVERSSDATRFYKIGEVAGSGNSNTSKTYNFIDELNNAKVTFFRLKQVDYSGSYTYSNVISLNNDNTTFNPAMNIFPNPANNCIQIIGLTEHAYVYDTVGRIVCSITESGQTDISALAPGIYFVKTSTATMKFIKQ